MRRYKPVYVIILTLFLLPGLASLSFAASEPLMQAELSGKRIYFSEANGEMSRFDRSPEGLSRYAGLLSIAGAELFTLEWRKGIPADADLIVIPGPLADLTPDQSARLWAYLRNGGRLLLMADPVDPTRNTLNRALPAARGFFELTWADLGIRPRDDVLLQVLDNLDETPTPTASAEESEAEEVTEEAEVQSPAIRLDVMGTAADDSPVTTGVGSSLAFHTTRSIEIDAALSNLTVTPLIFAPDDFYGETGYNELVADGLLEFNIGTDTGFERHMLAVGVEEDSSGLRVVLIGDRDFARNGSGMVTSPFYSGAFVYPDNARFLLNATAWLLESTPPTVDFESPAATATATITPTVTPIPPTETPEPAATPGS